MKTKWLVVINWLFTLIGIEATYKFACPYVEIEVKQLQLVIVMFSFHSKLDLIAVCSHKYW